MESNQGTPSRCVVWLASGEEAPAGLLHVLSRRGVQVAVVADAPAVLREVMRGGVGRVVLFQPQRLSRAAELADALRQHYPGVSCLRFDATQAALTDTEAALVPMSSPKTEHTVPSGTDADGPDPIGASADPGGTSTTSEDRPRSDPPRPLISEEEFTMLLGPSPDEPRTGEASR